jgi:FdhD protein
MPDGAVLCRTLAGAGKPSNECSLAEEVAVAIAYGGIPHAVMMATPANLSDFAFGFSVTEGVANGPGDVRNIAIRSGADGVEIDVNLVPESLQRFLASRRVRNLRGNPSCGLCGIEDMDSIGRTPSLAHPAMPPRRESVRRATEGLRANQPLARITAGMHAAAWAMPDGMLALVREDVGRHNALDKLIGAVLREGCDLADGFCVVTSRCSFEMVQKAARAGMSSLAALGVPTALAVRTAQAAGLTLVARGSHEFEIFSCPEL